MCEVLSPEDLLLLNSVITWVSAGRESCGRLERWAPMGQTWKPEPEFCVTLSVWLYQLSGPVHVPATGGVG